MHLSISLLFSLLLTATAIASGNERCEAAVESAKKKSLHYNNIIQRQIGYDADWHNWEPEKWKERWSPTLTELCSYYPRQYNQVVMDDIAKQLATECTVTDVAYQKSIEFFEYDTILQKAFCYLDEDNEFVTLKNAWLPILAWSSFKDASITDKKYFTCTKGNKHVLGTINDFVNTKQDKFPTTAAVWKKIVDDAKKSCGNEFDDLESAIGAPFPDAQERWIKEHKTHKEFFDYFFKIHEQLLQEKLEQTKSYEKVKKRLEVELQVQQEKETELLEKLQKTESDKKNQEEKLSRLLKIAAEREQLQGKEKTELLEKLQKTESDKKMQEAKWRELEDQLKGRKQLQQEERLEGNKNSGNIASQTSIPAFFGLLSMAVFARRF